LQQGFNFIFVCLPESHPTLYEWLEYLDANGDIQALQQTQGQGRNRAVYTYRFVNGLPPLLKQGIPLQNCKKPFFPFDICGKTIVY
jgi:hypothetical protein